MSLITSLRSFRYYDNTSLFDYFLSFIPIFLLSKYTTIPLTLSTILVFVFSIVFHYIFRISTSSTQYLNKLFIKQ